MISQKPISLKIDINLLQELDKEVSTGWMKRNAHINKAIEAYLQMKDLNRYVKCCASAEDKQFMFNCFLKKYIPNLAEW